MTSNGMMKDTRMKILNWQTSKCSRGEMQRVWSLMMGCNGTTALQRKCNKFVRLKFLNVAPSLARSGLGLLQSNSSWLSNKSNSNFSLSSNFNNSSSSFNSNRLLRNNKLKRTCYANRVLENASTAMLP